MRTSNILDPIQPELDQSVYNGIDPKPSVLDFIEKLYYRALDHELGVEGDEWADLYLTGSLTTYQFSETSDADISVFPNYDMFWTKLGLDDREARKQLISLSIKHLDGTFLPGTTHPLQFFVVPKGTLPGDLYQPGLRSAYNFNDRMWFQEPEKDRVHDISIEYPDLYARAADMADKMNEMLDSGDDKAADQLWKDIHRKRQLDQQAGLGDFCEGNIVYKWFLHVGLFDRIRNELGEYIAKTAANIDYVQTGLSGEHGDQPDRVPWVYDPPTDTLSIGEGGSTHRQVRKWSPGEDETLWWYGVYLTNRNIVMIHSQHDQNNLYPEEIDQELINALRQVWPDAMIRHYDQDGDNAEYIMSKVAVDWNHDDLDPRIIDNRDGGMEVWERLEQQVVQLAQKYDVAIHWLPRNQLERSYHDGEYDAREGWEPGKLKYWTQAHFPHITGERSYFTALHEIGHGAFKRIYNQPMADNSLEEEAWCWHFALENSQVPFSEDTLTWAHNMWKSYDTPNQSYESPVYPGWFNTYDHKQMNEERAQGLTPPMNPNYPAYSKSADLWDRVTTKVIYDFDNDRILLGTQATAADIPDAKIIGDYEDGIVTLYDADKQWINPTYFRRLWHFSYPEHDLKDVYYKRGEDRVKLKTIRRRNSGYYSDMLGPQSEEDAWDDENVDWGTPKYLYRAMSEDHFQQSMRDGVHQSDERGNWIGQSKDDPDFPPEQAIPEGTVAGRWSYPGYLANSPNGIGRIVKIEVRPEDGWEPHTEADDEGGYFRTFKPIPTDRFVGWTEPMDGRTFDVVHPSRYPGPSTRYPGRKHQSAFTVTAMADRSGIPEVDSLIEDFLKTPQGEWTTDELPIDALRNPELAHGMCEEVTRQFVDFAKQRGFKAYVTQTDLDEVGYEPTGEGGEIGFDDNNEMQYGFYPEHTIATIAMEDPAYPYGREVYIDFTASQYGYTDHPKVFSKKSAFDTPKFEEGDNVILDDGSGGWVREAVPPRQPDEPDEEGFDVDPTWWYYVYVYDSEGPRGLEMWPEDSMRRPTSYDKPGESTMKDWLDIPPEGEDYYRAAATNLPPGLELELHEWRGENLGGEAPWEDENDQENAWVVSALLDNTRIGYLVVGGNGKVRGVYVQPEYRRMGIAKAMYDYAGGADSMQHDWENMSDEGRSWAEKVGGDYGDELADPDENWKEPYHHPKDFQPGDQVEYLWSNRPMFGYIMEGPMDYGHGDWFWRVRFETGVSVVRDSFLQPAEHIPFEGEDLALPSVDDAAKTWPDTIPVKWRLVDEQDNG